MKWRSLETRGYSSSLRFFQRIHCGDVSFKKDKYLTPSHRSKFSRSSHSIQYCRYQYFHFGIIFLLHCVFQNLVWVGWWLGQRGGVIGRRGGIAIDPSDKCVRNINAKHLDGQHNNLQSRLASLRLGA